MAKLSDLIAQRETLDKQIADAQRTEKAGAIAKVKALMAEYGLSAADIAGKGRGEKTRATAGKKVAIKYRDKAGNTWTGRGLKPKWLNAALASGKKLQDFAA